MRVVRAWLGTLRAFETHRLGSGVDGWNDYCRASLGKGQSGNLPRNLAITLRDFGARELLTRPGRSLTHQRAAAAAQRVRVPTRPLRGKRLGRDAQDQLARCRPGLLAQRKRYD